MALGDVFLRAGGADGDVLLSDNALAPPGPSPTPEPTPTLPRAYTKGEIAQGGGFFGSPSMFSGGGVDDDDDNTNRKQADAAVEPVGEAPPRTGPDVKKLAAAFGFGVAASALVDFVMTRARRDNPASDLALEVEESVEAEIDARTPLEDLPASGARALRRCYVCSEEKVLSLFPRGRHWRTCTECRLAGAHRSEALWRVCVVCEGGFETRSRRALVCSPECRAEHERRRRRRPPRH